MRARRQGHHAERRAPHRADRGRPQRARAPTPRPPARVGTSTSSPWTRPPAAGPARPPSPPRRARPSCRPPSPARRATVQATSVAHRQPRRRRDRRDRALRARAGPEREQGLEGGGHPGPGCRARGHMRSTSGQSQLVDGFANGWQVTAADLQALGGSDLHGRAHLDPAEGGLGAPWPSPAPPAPLPRPRLPARRGPALGAGPPPPSPARPGRARATRAARRAVRRRPV